MEEVQPKTTFTMSSTAPSIRERIDEIGAELINDTFTYPDVLCDLSLGVIPRGLIYEDREHDPNGRGAVVVGINPGHASAAERRCYLQRGRTYEIVKDYWWEHLHGHPYHQRLRKCLAAGDIGGPILWTELVKCESVTNVKELSVQTIRDCIDRYLVREIACVPDNWVLVGAGAKAFEILAYRFPRRLVIGVPHPTGSRGHFQKLLPAGKLDVSTKEQLNSFLAGGSPIAAMFRCGGGQPGFR
jgi:uracil DNA glycosylase superfamily protein